MAPRRAAALRTHGEHLHANLRDHLVAMTGHLLEEVPLSTLTTRQIARHAGVSDGVLYNHFADKGALVLASLVDRFATHVAELEATAPAAGQGTVEANLRVYAHALRALEAHVLLLGAGVLGDPELLQGFWVEIHRSPFGPDRLVQPLRRYLEAERAIGRLSRALDVDAAVTLISGASAMVALTRRLNPQADAAHLDARLDGAIATLLAGLTG